MIVDLVIDAVGAPDLSVRILALVALLLVLVAVGGLVIVIGRAV